MGPNGSGKSTLAYVIAGHPHYEVTEGDILIDSESLLDMEADEPRTRRRLPGVPIPRGCAWRERRQLLRTAVSNVRGYTQQAENNGNSPAVIGSNLMPMREFRRELNEKMKEFNVDPSFAPLSE